MIPDRFITIIRSAAILAGKYQSGNKPSIYFDHWHRLHSAVPRNPPQEEKKAYAAQGCGRACRVPGHRKCRCRARRVRTFIGGRAEFASVAADGGFLERRTLCVRSSGDS